MNKGNIMLKSGKEKNILRQGLIVLGLMAALYIFFLNPFLKEGKSIMDEELERKTTEIKKYIKLTGSLPSRESFSKLEKENAELENRFSELVNFIDPEKARLSKSDTEAGLYFIERLHSTMKKFETESSAKGIKLPENLGFGDGLPKDNMVSVLIRQLEIMEFVVEALLKSEKINIYTLKPLKSIEYLELGAKTVFYTELPVQVSIRTDNKTLINLLLGLKNISPVISVKELHLKSDEASRELEASMVLSSFAIARPVK